MNPLLFAVDALYPTVWQILIATALVLPMFTTAGLVYPFVSKKDGKKGTPEYTDDREPKPVESDSGQPKASLEENKDSRLILNETYLNLRNKLIQNRSTPIEPGDTEKEIINKLMKEGVDLDHDLLSKAYSLYEISRFSQTALSEQDLKEAISLAEELYRRIS